MLEKHPWEKVELESLNPLISRRMLSGEQSTIARVYLKRGAIVPRHSHHNEQITFILAGALHFTFDDGELTLRQGEVLLIPPNVPHAAEAVEDTDDLDVFIPRREDWINKQDDYLRAGSKR
ncbi:MAG TPA: cupin domain-containing protein [Candidatus Limnocylindrales bacterium]|jgi:unsaturated pyranuronate lyase|nr:cupin domain-containing protein [Candidatus Limnocylindrales bacterium]